MLLLLAWLKFEKAEEEKSEKKKKRKEKERRQIDKLSRNYEEINVS